MLQTILLRQIVMKRPQLYIIFRMSTGNLPYLSRGLFKVLFVLSLKPFFLFFFWGGGEWGLGLSPYDGGQAKSLVDSLKIRGPSLAQTL